MDQAAHESYLEAQVMTASPQKLRLMLIEAATAAARRTLDHWDQGEHEPALESLVHCRSIISELLAGVRIQDSELAERVAGIYVFLFQSLTSAQLQQDRQGLVQAIRILEIERETWRQVCEKHPQAAPQASERLVTKEITAADARTLLQDAPQGGEADSQGTGIVLDA